MQNISLKNAIIEHIYQEILDSKYAPNDHIKEVELAKTLNVSRAPVREALNDLVNYGILEKFERRGIFLKEITKKEILDTYQTKGMIEGYLAADFILNATEQVIKRIKELQKNSTITSINNTKLKLKADTICVHGDTKEALEFIKVLKKHIK
jgi:DNA-binding GntR family transcriptional regulator